MSSITQPAVPWQGGGDLTQARGSMPRPRPKAVDVPPYLRQRRALDSQLRRAHGAARVPILDKLTALQAEHEAQRAREGRR